MFELVSVRVSACQCKYECGYVSAYESVSVSVVGVKVKGKG